MTSFHEVMVRPVAVDLPCTYRTHIHTQLIDWLKTQFTDNFKGMGSAIGRLWVSVSVCVYGQKDEMTANPEIWFIVTYLGHVRTSKVKIIDYSLWSLIAMAGVDR